MLLPPYPSSLSWQCAVYASQQNRTCMYAHNPRQVVQQLVAVLTTLQDRLAGLQLALCPPGLPSEAGGIGMLEYGLALQPMTVQLLLMLGTLAERTATVLVHPTSSGREELRQMVSWLHALGVITSAICTSGVCFYTESFLCDNDQSGIPTNTCAGLPCVLPAAVEGERTPARHV